MHNNDPTSQGVEKMLIHHLSIGGSFKRMELIEVKTFNLGGKGETLYNL
jgi:hypothetical protein